jgi:hypothetical protein
MKVRVLGGGCSGVTRNVVLVQLERGIKLMARQDGRLRWFLPADDVHVRDSDASEGLVLLAQIATGGNLQRDFEMLVERRTMLLGSRTSISFVADHEILGSGCLK